MNSVGLLGGLRGYAGFPGKSGFGVVSGDWVSQEAFAQIAIPPPPHEKILLSIDLTTGTLRKGPPFHGSQSSREIELQNVSCQMGSH